ncbi:hypothetical protein GQR58_011827 [Nymphon striatum]|nr:hypothetical protein GQR58_011827 [Nymphon striatum]
MQRSCDACPGTEALKEFLEELFNENEMDDDDNVEYKQWMHTDRTQLVTVSVKVNLPFYSEFDCKSAGVLVRWNKWRARLENNAFVGYNITDDCQKKALPLSYAGNDLNDIVDSLPSADLLPGEGETHFNKLTNAITNHFNPQINTEFQRYTFRKLTQKSDQIDDFF